MLDSPLFFPASSCSGTKPLDVSGSVFMGPISLPSSTTSVKPRAVKNANGECWVGKAAAYLSHSAVLGYI